MDIPYRDDIIRVELSEFPPDSEEYYLSIRQWFNLDGQWKPTKKGINVPVGLWPSIANAIQQLGL